MTRDLLEYVMPWLVDNPDEIEITEIEREGEGVVFEIAVHPDDVGKVIGKRGRIIRSLRSLARAAGHESGHSVGVEVVD